MISSGDIAAIVILLASFIGVLGFKVVRESNTTLLATWFVIALHVLVAVINRYLFTVIGADSDAKTFQSAAEMFANTQEWIFEIDALFYEQLLGFIYVIFGSSHLLGESLSVFVFAMSCVVLLKMMRLLKIDEYKNFVILLYGALPSMVLIGSVTLREPYQILFFMIAIYYGLIFQIKGSVMPLLAALMASAVMAFFHKGLVIYALFFGAIIAIWPVVGTPRWDRMMITRVTTILFVFVALSTALVAMYSSTDIVGVIPLKAILEGKGLEFIDIYRQTNPASRADYGLLLDYSSLINLITSAFKLFFYYLFAPFPWQVTNSLDLYAIAESILRLLLIIFCIKTWLTASNDKRSLYGLLLVLYFSMAFLWALGTTNYGTAIRHHLVNYWIIVMLGLPSFLSFVSPALKWFKRSGKLKMHSNRQVE